MQPYFRSVKVNNLLSFGPDSPSMEFGMLNVIIGANASGKSNLFDVFALLKNTPGQFDQPIIDSGCPLSEWFWKDENENNNGSQEKNFSASLLVKLALSKPFYHYLSLSKDSENSLSIEFEEINMYQEDHDIDDTENFICDSQNNIADKTNLSQVRVFINPSDEKYEVAEFYKNIHIYSDWTLGRSSPIRQKQINSYYPSKWLREDESNLCRVLLQIKKEPKTYERYLGYLKKCYDGIDDFEIKLYDDEMRIWLHEGKRRIHAARLSDGTLRYLMLMAVLCDPTPPPVICIEEPETGLHPDLIHVIADALEYASQRTQVFATSHSVDMVDYFTQSPDVIHVCEKYDGQTYIERLDSEYIADWLEKYRLCELWTSGEIGGNRW